MSADVGLLLHALGLSDSRRTGPSYRNRFVAGDGHADMPGLLRLCAAGLMVEVRRPGFLPDGDRLFMATEAGRVEAERQRPRLTRGRRRYHDWLRLADVCPDLTFGAYLRGEGPQL